MRFLQVVTGRTMRYGDAGAMLNGFVMCYRLRDRDSWLWARWQIAPFVKAWYWYLGARWCVERWSIEWEIRQTGKRSTLIREGDYYRNHWFHTGEYP